MNRYIRSPANASEDRQNMHLDSDDKQLDLVLFAELDSRYKPHIIDRFAYALNKLPHR
jgi:hypothetical protein